MYVLEVHHQGKPSLWTVGNREGFVEKCKEIARKEGPNFVIWEKSSPQKMLADCGVESIEEARLTDDWIAELADQHGLDSDIYMTFSQDWTRQPIIEFDACKAYLSRNLLALFIFNEVGELKAAMDAEKEWPSFNDSDMMKKLLEEFEIIKSFLN
jgi:hypothetical protein